MPWFTDYINETGTLDSRKWVKISRDIGFVHEGELADHLVKEETGIIHAARLKPVRGKGLSKLDSL